MSIAAESLLVLILIAGLASIVVYSLATGISPTPTSSKVRRRLLTALPASTGGTLVELGSGWGTLAFALADRFPDARVVAFELSPVPFAFSRLRQRLMPRANLELVREDFFRASLAEASGVVCYLFPGAMRRLAPKLDEELAPGAFVLSHTFALRGWRPAQTIVVNDLYRTPIYLYEILGGRSRAAT